jgi:hypothetical protein
METVAESLIGHPQVDVRSSPSRKRARVPSSDGRSADSVFLRKKHEELTRHVGGRPSSTQLALIRRIARLELYVDRLDADAMANGGRLSDHASKVYLAYVNSVGRLSRQLGFQGATTEREPAQSPLEQMFDLPTAKAAQPR